MTDRVAVERPREDRWRGSLAGAGLALFALSCVPDLAGVAGGSETAQTLCFSIIAMVAPALVTVGSPWTSLHWGKAWLGPRVARLAALRAGRQGLTVSIAVLVVDLAVIVCWRTPMLVDAVARHPALVLVEALTLGAAGIALWLELVGVAPFGARPSMPVRAVLAAVTMWTVWTLAFLDGMSSTGWYHAFRHVAGTGLSASADREFAATVLWSMAAMVFIPVVFASLFRWLRAEGGGEAFERATSSSFDPIARY